MKCNETVIALGCGHIYHKTCLVEWFKKGYHSVIYKIYLYI